jgi:RNA polymerase sigma-70 factor (ECF subfamily)
VTFEEVINTFGSMVWRVALSHERNVAVAEELYQDICFALWKARDRIDQAESPRAYVARIAMNQAVSHVRREVRQPETVETAEEPGQSPSVDEAQERHHQQEQLLAAVQQLPLNWRQPVMLTLEGFKPQEIAYVMGTSANSISLRLTRAKQALRRIINTTGQDHGNE